MRHESIADEQRLVPPARQAVTRPRSRVTETGRHLYAVADEVTPLTKEHDMAAVGKVAAVMVGLVILTGIVIGVASAPDVNRYLRIRRM
jgi:hypothetical protein